MVAKMGSRCGRLGIVGLSVMALCISMVGSVPADAATKAPASTITLALAFDKTGAAAIDQAGAGQVLSAWAKSVNGQGGIAGHPVKIDFVDTQATATVALSKSQALIGDNSVSAVIGINFVTEAVAASTLNKAGLPVVGVGFGPAWNTLANYYPIANTAPYWVYAQFYAPYKLGLKSAGVAICTEVPSCAQAQPIFKSALPALGMRYTGAVGITQTDPSFAAQCLTLLNAKSNFIQISALSTAEGLRVVKDCQTQGYRGYFGFDDSGVNPALLKTVPNAKVAGALNTFPWFVSAGPVAKYRATMSKYGVPATAWQHTTSTGAWASAELIRTQLAQYITAQHIGSTASITRQVVRAALDSTKNVTLGGLLPQPLTFTAGKPSQPINCFWIYTLKNGKYVNPNGGLNTSCIPKTLVKSNS